MKAIVVNADERLVELARQCAADEGATLDAKIIEWLEGYTRRRHAEKAMGHIEEMCRTVRVGGRRFTREEMNER